MLQITGYGCLQFTTLSSMKVHAIQNVHVGLQINV